MLGIIGAMDKETGMLFDSMTGKEEKECGCSRFVKGTLEGVEVLFSHVKTHNAVENERQLVIEDVALGEQLRLFNRPEP